MSKKETSPTEISMSPSCDPHQWCSVYGPTILEQALLAIIRATPCSNRFTDQKRLSQAIEALLGQSTSIGRSMIDDHDALAHMAEADQRNRAMGIKISRTTLARNATHLTSGNSDDAIVARLVQRYGERGKEIILHLAYEDDIAADLEKQALEALFDALRRANVPFARPSNFKS